MTVSATATANGLELISDGASNAGVRQSVATSSLNVRHAINIVVTRGPVRLKLGSSSGGTEYFDTYIRTGFHSLSFVPATSPIWIEITSQSNLLKIVKSVAVAPAGEMVLPSPYTAAQIREVTYEQQGDIVYFARSGIPKRLERRGPNSWSLTDIDLQKGPWRIINTDDSILLTPSVKTGSGTLTCNKSLFKSGHVGSLWKLVHTGQSKSRSLNGPEQYTEAIHNGDVGTNRPVSISITGTFTGTIRLFRSVGNTENWIEAAAFSAPTTTTVDDSGSYANTVNYYRLGIKNGEWTSGNAVCTLSYKGGTSEGVCRVTKYTSATSVDIDVLSDFSQTGGSALWYEGEWSDYRGWPRAITFFDGRLWGGLNDKMQGSMSGIYENFTPGEKDGDAITRTIATGRVNPIVWFMPLARIIAGTEGAEVAARSSNFDAPLTPTAMTLRDVSSYGVASGVPPVKVDTRGLYVDRSKWRMMELRFDVQQQDYVPASLMAYHKYIGQPGIIDIAVARFPDTRIFAVRSDGQLLCLLYDPANEVLGWQRWITDGLFESVMTLPGEGEDEIYVVVARTIGGVTKRFVERFSSVVPVTPANATVADCAVVYSGVATNTVTGLSHLNGKTVVIWADGSRRDNAVVSGGSVTVSGVAAVRIVVGLAYTARYKSRKLSVGAQGGTGMSQLKRPTHVSFHLLNAVQAIRYGGDFVTMDNMPDRAMSTKYDAATAVDLVETEPLSMPVGRKRDSRMCIEVQAPYPVTMLGYVASVENKERVT